MKGLTAALALELCAEDWQGAITKAPLSCLSAFQQVHLALVHLNNHGAVHRGSARMA